MVEKISTIINLVKQGRELDNTIELDLMKDLLLCYNEADLDRIIRLLN